MNAPRLEIPAGLKRRMVYPKCVDERPRALILEGQYWLDGACARAGRAMGWDIATVPVVMEGLLPRDALQEILVTLANHRPDFILSINLSAMDEHGLIAALFADLGVPLVTWFVDDPRTILMGRTCFGTNRGLALSWERAYLPALRAAGFADVQWMPLAADLSLFNAETAETAGGPPAFLGNSMVAFAAREREWIAARPALAAAVDRVLEAGILDRERFAAGIESLFTPEELEGMDADARRHAELYLFIEGTRRYRHRYVRALLPEGLEVHGDDGWSEVLPQPRPPVHYMDAAPAFYRGRAVNLNLTSIQMAAAVNQRVFDVPAAGGFLLTDAQGDLETLFEPEVESAVFHTPGEARDKMRFYLRNPEARRKIATSARRRILAGHTYAHRLREIYALVRDRWGG